MKPLIVIELFQIIKKYMRQPALSLQKSFNLYHNMSAEGQGPRIV